MAVVADFGLPPGAYERDGKFYRTIHVEGVDERGEYEEEIEREVLLPIATDEESIARSRERAAAKGLDFYDPRVITQVGYEPEVIGWLDRGRKREKDWAWNVDNTAITRKRRYKTAATAAPAPKEHSNGK